MSKLHRLQGGEREGIGVDVPPTVINNPTRPTVTLGDDTWRGDAEPREIADCGVGKDNPLPFVDHVHEFSFEIVDVLVGGFMRAP